MVQMRRSFLKTAVVASAITTVGASVMIAGEKTTKTPTNGVVIGKSKKREITYKKTEAWEDYYRSAV